ncbi:hypothetical protein Droror1_Dr00019050 [Drosera rotundifolia]
MDRSRLQCSGCPGGGEATGRWWGLDTRWPQRGPPPVEIILAAWALSRPCCPGHGPVGRDSGGGGRHDEKMAGPWRDPGGGSPGVWGTGPDAASPRCSNHHAATTGPPNPVRAVRAAAGETVAKMIGRPPGRLG